MDFSNAMKISSSGLSVQRKRIEVISSNLANIETTRTEEGGPYRRKDLVVTALPVRNEFGEVLKTQLGDHLKEASITQVIEDQTEPRLVFNPDHPDANELGYVSLPNINLLNEMVNLISATRTFEANISAVTASKSMARRAIELGR